MNRKTLAIIGIAVLLASMLGTAAPAAASVPVESSSLTPPAPTVESLGMFSVPKWTVHYRAPNIEQIETLLEEQGIPLAGPEARAKAVQAFRHEWAERNPTTPDPEKLKKLLDKERQGQLGLMAAEAAAVPQIMSLAVPVEFPNSDTFDWCEAPVTTKGPLHNQIPPPGHAR